MLTGYRRTPAAPATTVAATQQALALAFALQFRPIPLPGLRYLPLTNPRRA